MMDRKMRKVKIPRVFQADRSSSANAQALHAAEGLSAADFSAAFVLASVGKMFPDLARCRMDGGRSPVESEWGAWVTLHLTVRESFQEAQPVIDELRRRGFEWEETEDEPHTNRKKVTLRVGWTRVKVYIWADEDVECVVVRDPSRDRLVEGTRIVCGGDVGAILSQPELGGGPDVR